MIISEMQSKLATWSSADKERKFDRLLRMIADKQLFGRSDSGSLCGVTLRRLVTSRKAQFRWRNPEANPYILRDEERNTVTSRYHDVAMAMSHA